MKPPAYYYFRVKTTKDGLVIEDASDADVVEVVRCKDCVHRPVLVNLGENAGHSVRCPRYLDGFSDYTCPYLCSDPWYNEMPEDDWFCHLGEREDNG